MDNVQKVINCEGFVFARVTIPRAEVPQYGEQLYIFTASRDLGAYELGLVRYTLMSIST
jgi:hypothetical protein